MATIRIPTSLRKFTNGRAEIVASGATVGATIEDLERQCPGIRERLLDESGSIRRFLNIYLGDEDVRFRQQLATPVTDRDELSIIPAIAGG